MRDANKLVAGIDYPRTLKEFDNFFSNENAWRKYLVQLRWPQDCQCPASGRNWNNHLSRYCWRPWCKV